MAAARSAPADGGTCAEAAMDSTKSLQFGTEIILQAEQLAGHSDDPDALTVA
jgi:hypothetical protein